ncbi:MAG: amidohydrolase family protein [Bryobacterales bacterium]|nr:amidohydrolase family protein [Bryobacterales bacterium]
MRRAALFLLLCGLPAAAQIAIRGETVYTMAGPPVRNGVVVITDGRIARVGPADTTPVPSGYRLLSGKVVTPGLIDARTVVGLAGYLNQAHDQDQLERSAAIQPELRAIDAYDPRERLIEYLRGYGITTIHTGHAPGALVSGQTMIVKTAGKTVDEALVKPAAMVAATLGAGGRAAGGKAPGTRSKMVAMLRAEFIKAREYAAKRETAEAGKEPAPDLRLDALARVVRGELPLLVTVHQMHDVMTAIRLAKEFNLKLVLDGAADAQGLIDEIKASGYPVILHPTMARAGGETANLSLETASKLQAAGIPYALQSGFESYVPKTRVVLFEAALAAANGLSFEDALASVTIGAARLLGIADRVGSIESGKDADVAVYDGDPFEYATHCTAVVLNGRLVSEAPQ